MNFNFNKVMIALGTISLWFICFWFVQLLWNWIAVSLFGFPVITYWEAFGLTCLVKLFIKGVSIEFKKND